MSFLAPTPSSAQLTMARLLALAAVAALLPAYTAGVAIGIDLGWLRAHQNSPHKQQQHVHAHSHLEHTRAKNVACCLTATNACFACMLPCSSCAAPLFDSQQVPHACHVDLITVLWIHGKLHYTCCLMAR
jgi:hypothetical protein